MSLRYLSVCSGIEAATVAWHPLGWQPLAFSEIDLFGSAVLAHHYPGVPNWGDMTTFQEWPDADVDVLVGGTPCQSFSVAGLRKGLADPRGNLVFTYLAIADRFRPRWLVWENVPGVLSSDGGRAFGSLLGGLAELGYGFAYRVLDAQFFGVAQRRRRVFVVGYFGDWRRAAAVLFERASLSGHPAPRREAGQDVAATVSASPPSRRNGGSEPTPGHLVAFGGNNTSGAIDVAPAVLAKGGTGRSDFGSEAFVTAFDARQSDAIIYGDKSGPLDTDGHTIGVLAFSSKDHGADVSVDVAPTLRAGGFTGSHANGGVMPAVAFNLRGRDGGAMPELSDVASLRAASGGSSRSYIGQHMAVRRLTPRECERLQGFPDDYTLIPYRGKPASDGPRYKALGNSMAVPVMAWIGRRIQLMEGV